MTYDSRPGAVKWAGRRIWLAVSGLDARSHKSGPNTSRGVVAGHCPVDLIDGEGLNV